MIHLSEFRIHRFRGLRDLTLAGLGDFNLLVGPNNCGKSSILEAVACHINPLNIVEWLDIGRLREIKSSRTSLDYSMSLLFPQQDDRGDRIFTASALALGSQRQNGALTSLALYNVAINVTAPPPAEGAAEPEIDEEGTGVKQVRTFRLAIQSDRTLDQNDLAALDNIKASNSWAEQFTYKTFAFESRNQSFSSVEHTPFDLNYDYVGVATHRTAKDTIEGISRAIKDGLRDIIITILKLIDDSITGIELLALEDQPVNIYLRRGNVVSPITAYGDGIRRLVHIIAASARAGGGVLLIDELEIGLHAEAMRRVLPTLPLLCKAFQIQILATTHSLEVVDACIAVLPPEESSLVLYRLPDRTANDKTIRRFDGPDVKLMRSEYGMEVR